MFISDMENESPILEAIDVSKTYSDAFAGLLKSSVEVAPLERLGIVGETGSGKSTLMKIIGGLVQSDSGKVFFQGQKLMDPYDQLIPGHAEIAYLSQHFELPRFISVHEHLEDRYANTEEEMSRIFESCRITHLLDRNTSELSGGEKQRVALAKLLLASPKVLLLDEPFSNLDFIHKNIMRQVIENLQESLGVTIIMVTHDPRDVLSWASRVIVMKSGEMIQIGSPKELYDNPNDTYIAGLFGPFDLVSSELFEKEEITNSTRFEEKVIVRPEEFWISESNGMSVQVTGLRYYGAYDEVIVEAKGEKFSIHAEVDRFKIGDSLLLNFRAV